MDLSIYETNEALTVVMGFVGDIFGIPFQPMAPLKKQFNVSFCWRVGTPLTEAQARTEVLFREQLRAEWLRLLSCS